MKKVKKTVNKSLRTVRILFLVFLVALFIYNRYMLVKEKPLLKPLGQMVEVDGYNMCIYSEGKGEYTLVFLSGSAIASPILEYKPIYSLLSEDYNIVVIEKFGYGFSDVIDEERSFETMLRQDREALAKAGIEGPYILCPHSMSGIEAILWAQTYPEEVAAIIGLDMALPATYSEEDFIWLKNVQIMMLSVWREMGFVRLFFNNSSFSDTLSQREKEIYRAIACTKYVNKNVRNEGKHILEAIALINSQPKPDVPMLMFISSGIGVGGESWITAQKEYAADLSYAKTVQFDCGHAIYLYEQNQINQDIREFIESLNK